MAPSHHSLHSDATSSQGAFYNTLYVEITLMTPAISSLCINHESDLVIRSDGCEVDGLM